MNWTIQKLIQWSSEFLAGKGVENARLDTELLLAHVLKWQRVKLYTHFDQPLQEDELQAFKILLKRRAAREPLAYILGEKEFYSLKFKVTSDTLIPRPETEHLVEWGLEFCLDKLTAPNKDSSANTLKILDLATGSGCVLLALLFHLKEKQSVQTNAANCEITGLGVDLSAEALSVAGENAQKIYPKENIQWLQHDLSQPWPDTLNGPFDLITANLPYVSRAEHQSLASEVKDFEPTAALVPGVQIEQALNDTEPPQAGGLEAFHWVLPKLSTRLNPGGLVLLEIGADQGQALRQLTQELSPKLHCEILKDLSGLDRVAKLHPTNPKN